LKKAKDHLKQLLENSKLVNPEIDETTSIFNEDLVGK